jgi:hypothetical protein
VELDALRRDLAALRGAAAAEAAARRAATRGGAGDDGEDSPCFDYTLPERALFAEDASPTEEAFGRWGKLKVSAQ